MLAYAVLPFEPESEPAFSGLEVLFSLEEAMDYIHGRMVTGNERDIAIFTENVLETYDGNVCHVDDEMLENESLVEAEVRELASSLPQGGSPIVLLVGYLEDEYFMPEYVLKIFRK